MPKIEEIDKSKSLYIYEVLINQLGETTMWNSLMKLSIFCILFILITISMQLLSGVIKNNHEIPRKGGHMLVGVLISFYPWYFTRNDIGIICGSTFLMLLILLIIRKVSKKNTINNIFIYQVNREKSVGELWFPVSVIVLCCISNMDKILFSIPMLILAISDVCAAVVGIKYGKHILYLNGENKKTLEGSIAFFISTFVIVATILSLYGNLSVVYIIILAFCIAIIGTLTEMISKNGFDNLLTPIFCCFVLKYFYIIKITIL